MVASFRCYRSDKVIYVVDEDGEIEFGSTFVPSDITGWAAIEYIRKQNCARMFPTQPGYLANFIKTHERTMRREL